jgi:hypothetical protein
MAVAEGQLKGAVHRAVANADFAELLRMQGNSGLSKDAKQAVNGVLDAVRRSGYTTKPFGWAFEMAVIHKDPQVLNLMQRSVSDPQVVEVIQGVVSGLSECTVRFGTSG